MKVFADFHHSSLLNSLIMLFEGRLGGEVYRPIGQEWAEKGFWKVFNHPATQAQYLDIGNTPKDGSQPLNNVLLDDRVEGIYYCNDIEGDRTNKAIEFETFLDMDIDIVIASLPQHIEPFKRLIREHKPKAKLIYQVGNAWSISDGLADNIMASAIIDVPSNINSVRYHQEFDLNIFKPIPLWPGLICSIDSFINVPESMPDYPLLLELEKLMKYWLVTIRGGQSRDGALEGSKMLADGMNSCGFIWAVKAGGDGYGHILYNAAACGKPLIVKKSYYQGKLGEELLINGETCINIDGMPVNEIKAALEFYSDPKRYQQMCKNVYRNFKQCVDFDKEFEDIKSFLWRLI